MSKLAVRCNHREAFQIFIGRSEFTLGAHVGSRIIWCENCGAFRKDRHASPWVYPKRAYAKKGRAK